MKSDLIRLGLVWKQNRQTLYKANEVFTHEGAITTQPSHDLAHILVAASGDIPWRPTGDSRNLRIAEYNAVFLECLLDALFNSVVFRCVSPASIPALLHKHTRWFVNKHFAPFPISAQDAYRGFCLGIRESTIVRLCPLFFQQKWQERFNPDIGLRQCTTSFYADDIPTAEGDTLLYRELVRIILSEIVRGARRG
jgi:hypothetical protein